MSLSSPITRKPCSMKKATDSEPIRPPEPVTMAVGMARALPMSGSLRPRARCRRCYSSPPGEMSALVHGDHVRAPGRERVVGLRFTDRAELVVGRAREAEAVARVKAPARVAADVAELDPPAPRGA